MKNRLWLSTELLSSLLLLLLQLLSMEPAVLLSPPLLPLLLHLTGGGDDGERERPPPVPEPETRKRGNAKIAGAKVNAAQRECMKGRDKFHIKLHTKMVYHIPAISQKTNGSYLIKPGCLYIPKKG